MKYRVVPGSFILSARVRHRATLAELQLELGHLEAACVTWNQALDDYPMVESGRADERMRAMFGAIRPHLRNAHARALHERARAVTGAKFNS